MGSKPNKGSWLLYYNITNIPETSIKYLQYFAEVSEIDVNKLVTVFLSFDQFCS